MHRKAAHTLRGNVDASVAEARQSFPYVSQKQASKSRGLQAMRDEPWVTLLLATVASSSRDSYMPSAAGQRSVSD